MQYSGHLDINPQPGQAVSQIPTGWFKYVNNVLRFLQVRNGRLIVDNDRWTIECGRNVWSGYYWFGGLLNGEEPSDDIEPITQIEGRYFGINLRTGETQFKDEPDNFDEWEWRYVADKNEDTDEYTLSRRTCGDIVFRIT